MVVLKLDRDRLLKLLDSDTQSGYLFFKHLSRALGERLVQAYQQLWLTLSTFNGGNHGQH